MPDSQPNRLGKYEILAEIGKGGFATVYRARDTDLGRDVALKVLDPLLMRDPAWVARFRNEARAVASLDHPRIVPIYEIGQAEGILFIAMKLLESGSLADRLAQGALPWPEVVRLTGEIAEALDFAHGRNVLHRDLKPANVLLDAAGHAVLTDFGFAQLVSDHSLSVSISGGIIGTPAYIAPEVWEGQPPLPQTDLYALGCIVYEMATGAQPFGGATTPAITRAHFQPLVLPKRWPEGTPPDLGDVLAVALAKAPADRCARAEQLAEAVTKLDSPQAANEPARAAMGAEPARIATSGAPARRSSPLRVWLTAGFSGLAILAFAIFAIVTSRTPLPVPSPTPATAVAAATGTLLAAPISTATSTSAPVPTTPAPRTPSPTVTRTPAPTRTQTATQRLTLSALDASSPTTAPPPKPSNTPTTVSMLKDGDIVALKCLGHIDGPRWLNGRTGDGGVDLAPQLGDTATGTKWQVLITDNNTINLKCLGDIEGPRWLNGRTGDGRVDLAPQLGDTATGTKWQALITGNNTISLKCLGNIEGPRWLNGGTATGTVNLAPQTSGYSGTQWEVVHLGPK